VVVTVAAYFAGYLVHHQSLHAFFPPWLLTAIPALLPFTRWLPADLLTLALWLGLLAALGFGLVASTWRGVWGGTLAAPSTLSAPHSSPRHRTGVLMMGLALLGALGVLLYLAVRGGEPRPVQIVWVIALLAYLFGAGLLRVRHPSVSFPWPERGWPVCLLILLVAAVGFAWPLPAGSAGLDEESAQRGLQALALLRGTEPTLFTNGNLAVGLTALAIALTGDPLLGLRSASLGAGLLVVWGTWLLGCELFRRSSNTVAYAEPLEDEGQWVAQLAPALLVVSPVMLYASRFPLHLEPVAWGVLGLWAWLRGIRSLDPLALAASGLLIGLASGWYTSGLVFSGLVPLWWLGIWLLQPAWLQPLRQTRGGLIWLGGWLVTIAPMLGLWLRAPEQFLARFQGTLLPNVPTLLTLFNLDSDRTPLWGYPSDAVALIAAPLLILAVGALLLNLDRVVGWALFTWLGVALVVGVALGTSGLTWPPLLPLLPALALALAFTADRLRITLLEAGGLWLAQATTYLAIGLVVWAGLQSWVEIYRLAGNSTTPASAVAYAVRTLPKIRPIGLVAATNPAPVSWATPAVALLTASQWTTQTHFMLQPDAWPTALPAQSILLILPEDRGLLEAVQVRYPGGVVRTDRDHSGNPILFRYELP
jgi:hypothetical protein